MVSINRPQFGTKICLVSDDTLQQKYAQALTRQPVACSFETISGFPYNTDVMVDSQPAGITEGVSRGCVFAVQDGQRTVMGQLGLKCLEDGIDLTSRRIKNSLVKMKTSTEGTLQGFIFSGKDSSAVDEKKSGLIQMLDALFLDMDIPSSKIVGEPSDEDALSTTASLAVVPDEDSIYLTSKYQDSTAFLNWRDVDSSELFTRLYPKPVIQPGDSLEMTELRD